MLINNVLLSLCMSLILMHKCDQPAWRCSQSKAGSCPDMYPIETVHVLNLTSLCDSVWFSSILLRCRFIHMKVSQFEPKMNAGNSVNFR